MAEIIRLDTGLKTFAVEFSDRKDAAGKPLTAEISFNPSDPDLAIRFTDLENRVAARVKEIPDVELDANGLPKDLSFVDSLKQLNEILYSEIDTAFGSPVSATVFQFCNPLATVAGDYFIVNFIRAVAPIIEKYAKKSNAESQKRMDKHIKGLKK